MLNFAFGRGLWKCSFSNFLPVSDTVESLFMKTALRVVCTMEIVGLNVR